MQLFVMKKGYLGLGLASLQPGDKICCTELSRSHYRLRESPKGKSRNPKQLVGAVFAHDLCNGNSQDMMADGVGHTSEKFVSWNAISISVPGPPSHQLKQAIDAF
jgi:hypothetical protein